MYTLKLCLLSLILLLVVFGAGQSTSLAESSSTVSTGQSSEDGDQISREEDAIEFLEGICGPDAEIEVRRTFLSAGRRATCAECPEEDQDGEVYTQSVIRGDFLGDGSDTVFLTVTGCMGRRIFLLRQEETGWTAVAENRGTAGCTRIEGERQDILLCRLIMGIDSGKEPRPELSRRYRAIYVEEGDIKSEMLTEQSHHPRTCGCGGAVGTELEELVFEDLSGDDRDELAMGFRTVLPADREFDNLDDDCIGELEEYREINDLYVWQLGSDGVERRRDIESTTEHPSLEEFKSEN